jgi:mycothiol synthase
VVDGDHGGRRTTKSQTTPTSHVDHQEYVHGMEERGIIDVVLSARRLATPTVRRALPQRLIPHAQRFLTQAIGPEMLYLLLPDFGTRSLAPPSFPDGYECHSLEPGRETDYVSVMKRSLVARADGQWFENAFRSDASYSPENLFLVYFNGQPVAAAAAQDDEWKDQPVGRLHMLGVIPEHRRRGLRTSLTLVTLHRMKERGFDQALVLTEDSHLGAIRIYLRLGLQPQYLHPVHRLRWRRVMRRLRPAAFANGGRRLHAARTSTAAPF